MILEDAFIGHILLWLRQVDREGLHRPVDMACLVISETLRCRVRVRVKMPKSRKGSEYIGVQLVQLMRNFS